MIEMNEPENISLPVEIQFTLIAVIVLSENF